ncbi:MAG: ABC transporter ATP-binding protein [Clostridia bacterium]|nr:ABC transporter ATP-binding protein [Clostridia bacterium]
MKKEKTSLKENRRVVNEKYAEYRESEKAEQQKPQNTLKTAKKLLSLLKGNRLWVAFVMVVTAASAVLGVIGPQYLKSIIDLISEQVERKLTVGNIDFSAIGGILRNIAVIFVLYAVCTFIINYVMARVTQDVITALRDKVNRKISHLPLSFFDSHNKGDLLSRVTNDIDNINNTFQHNFIQIVTSLVTFVGVLAVMLKESVIMSVVTIVPLPLGGLVALIILKFSRRRFREQWRETGNINGHIEEMFTGHQIVKAFGHEKSAIEEFTAINEELYSVSRKAQFLSGLINPVIGFAKNIGYVFICVIAGYFIIDGKMSLGTITAFMVYSNMFMQPLVDVSNIINNLQSSLASAERVFEIIESEEEVPDTVKTKIEKAKGFVDFENVCFSYADDKPLIENFNLSVKPGQLIAIVGPTGAGKTTLVNLLMRFYEIKSGSIKIDGTDIRDISRENLRNIFGMVLQDTWLKTGTIRENILYGHENVSEEEFMNAVKAAKVDHFVSTLADGFETVLDEDGSNLSSGQKQLLTIARAILADPQILILDEATSSVDTRTEVQIQTAMNNLMKGRTNFVIAHRLSTIKGADNILVIDDGKIVEHGTHEELLQKGGFYATLYNSQFCEQR